MSSDEEINLRGKRKELLENSVENESFRFDGLVMDIYDSRAAAKESLELFREKGWLEVVTNGVFQSTDLAEQKLDSLSKKDEKSLDSF